MRARAIAVWVAAGALLAQAPQRRVPPAPGLYNDFAAPVDGGLTPHVLAIGGSDKELAESRRERRTYEADHALGDPAGFSFIASNNNGVYDIGDRAPMLARTRLAGIVPLPAKLRILRGDEKVAEAEGYEIGFTPSLTGSYRLEARMGEERLWIRTAPIHLEDAAGRGITLPPGTIAPTVEVKKDIAYVEGSEADAAKHRLDLYLPKGRTAFPVLIFLHGGVWRSGDRSLYPALGNRFAKEGVGVVIPSYRLMPGAPHPAQIEDALAAVDWTVGNIEQHGGDVKRIWVSGHSAGGHLASWAGLERRLWPRLKGVISMSGVYDVSSMPQFQTGSVEPSPMRRVAAGAPPFTITYCQNDYPTLAAQARRFDEALRKAGVASELVYVAGKNHISEIADIWRDDDPTARAVLRAVLGR